MVHPILCKVLPCEVDPFKWHVCDALTVMVVGLAVAMQDYKRAA
jgi:hypothetical protein